VPCANNQVGTEPASNSVCIYLNSITFVITSVQVQQHTPTQHSNIAVCIRHKIRFITSSYDSNLTLVY